MTTWALVPAAGKSVRMGRCKLALPLGNRTILEHVIAALSHAGVANVLVVVSPDVAAELTPQAHSAGAKVLELIAQTPDMRATVEQGLAWLEQNGRLGPTDSWLLAPADHPTLDAVVVKELLQAQALHPEKSIFIPTHQGTRGHPALIGWRHVTGLRGLPAGQGLNQYLRTQVEQTLLCPVASAEVLRDLDTPADYQRLQAERRGH
jgi:molybdenum cofactor cytidylyltransferase